jgi:hypothetical protein
MLATTPRVQVLMTARPFASAPLVAGPSGTGGAALYLTEDASGQNPDPIEFRRLRFVASGGISLRRSARSKTTAVSLITEPTKQFTRAVNANSTYRIQVRSWRDDVENPQFYGEQVLVVDAHGDSKPLLDGHGYVTEIQKRQSGGMRVTVTWVSENTATAPETLTLTRVSGPTSVADVVKQWSESNRQYVFTATGLQNAGSYVFRVVAARGSFTVRAKRSFGESATDFTFVADGAGPRAVTGLTARTL